MYREVLKNHFCLNTLFVDVTFCIILNNYSSIAHQPWVNVPCYITQHWIKIYLSPMDLDKSIQSRCTFRPPYVHTLFLCHPRVCSVISVCHGYFWLHDIVIQAFVSIVGWLPFRGAWFIGPGRSNIDMYLFRANSRFAPSQWETSLQSNAVSHWLGANLKSALLLLFGDPWRCYRFGSASRFRQLSHWQCWNNPRGMLSFWWNFCHWLHWKLAF